MPQILFLAMDMDVRQIAKQFRNQNSLRITQLMMLEEQYTSNHPL